MQVFRIDCAVGRNCPNEEADVAVVATALMNIDKIPRTYRSDGTYDETIDQGIVSTQNHWMLTPDAVISPGGLTQNYIENWSIKPINYGVRLPGNLRTAWDMVNPLLPPGSHCVSGLRTIEEQRQILHEFFLRTCKHKIVQKIGRAAHEELSMDLLANEARVLELVRGAGQRIATPGSSKHQLGMAADIGGDHKLRRADITRMVARANPQLFSGVVRLEANGHVHFEIR
jgi:hypothetical protein